MWKRKETRTILEEINFDFNFWNLQGQYQLGKIDQQVVIKDRLLLLISVGEYNQIGWNLFPNFWRNLLYFLLLFFFPPRDPENLSKRISIDVVVWGEGG